MYEIFKLNKFNKTDPNLGNSVILIDDHAGLD